MATTTTAVATHTDDHADEAGSMDTLMKLKIALIVILFCIVYLGLIPAYSKVFRSSKLVLSLMNSFAGGVFLAMAFIHILPESVEQYNDAMAAAEEKSEAVSGNSTTAAVPAEEHDHEEHGHIFPLPYLLFFVGYMMVLLIDRVLAGEHGHSHGGHSGGEHSEHDHHEHHAEKDFASSDRKLVISPDLEKSPGKTNGDDLHKDAMVVQDIGNDFD
jgi:zinc transporter ZupT